jgi:ketosteroid isomerase-like protein/Spy/CpxP family protein refolding chaperone
MHRLCILAVTSVSLMVVGAALPSSNAVGQQQIQQTSDVERIHAASQVFIAAILARDISAMDKVWAHESYATFIGPLSTTVVVGWDGVRKAWEMRFGQFDRVTVSLAGSHAHTNGNVAWAVGIEKVQLQRKDGKTLNFDAFVTNVFEKRDGNWLMVSHQATPMFREVAGSQTQATSPYVGQQKRSIKALSDREISDLTEGRGMGLAKAAELNSYPGPLHVLELARELDLTDTQRAATESLFAAMRERAQPLGIKIIEAERELDQDFVDGTISTIELQSRLNAIAVLQGELRAVHLETHLAQRSVLTSQQVAKYDALRGYRDGAMPHAGHSHHPN